MSGGYIDYEMDVRRFPDDDSNTLYAIYRDGLWRVLAFNRSPDEDLRGAFVTRDRVPSTWTLRHMAGPNPSGKQIVKQIVPDEFEWATEMEVIAFFSL